MATSTNNKELISQEDWKNLEELSKRLDVLIKTLPSLVAEVNKVSDGFARGSANTKELSKNVEALNSLEKELSTKHNEINKALTQEDQVRKKIISTLSQEAKETKALAQAIEGVVGSRDLNIHRLTAEQNALKSVQNELKILDKQQRNNISTGEDAAARRANLIDRELQHKQAITELRQQLRSETKEMQAAGGSMEQMSQRLAQLKTAYRQLNKEERDGQIGQTLQKNIKSLDKELKSLDANIGNHQRNVGNYGSIWNKVKGVIALATAIIAGVTAAIKAAKPVIESTQQSGDNFRFSAEALRGSLEVLKKSIATADFSLFARNALDAAKASRELAQTLDAVFERTNSISLRRSEMSAELEELRENLQNQNLTYEQRVSAGEEYLKKIEGFYNEEIQLTKDVSEAQLLAVASRIKGSQQTQDAAAQELKTFIETYNLNLDLIEQANEYNKVLSGPDVFEAYAINAVGALPRFMKEQEELLASASQEVVEFAEILRRYNLTNDKELKAYVESQKQTYQAEAAFRSENRRIINSLNTARTQETNEREQNQKKQLDIARKQQAEEGKLRRAEINATQEQYSLILQAEIDANNAIVQNAGYSFEERNKALDNFIVKQIESIGLSAQDIEDNLVQPFLDAGKSREESEKLLASQIALIWAKEDAEISKITNEGEKTRTALLQSEAQKRIESIQKEAAARGNELGLKESNELTGAASEYAQGLISLEQYEQKKTDIVRKYAKERFDAEISMLRAQVDTKNLTEEESLKFSEQIAKAIVDNDIYLNDLRVKDSEDTAKQIEQIERQLADKRREIIGGVFDFISTLRRTNTDAELERLEEESDRNSEYYDEERERIDRLYEAGAISKEEADARKALADQQELDREREIENERKKIQRDQAVFERNAAIAKIIADMASAIFQITAQAAILAANPLTAPLAPKALRQIPLVVVSAGVQSGIILAQELPQYAQGTPASGHKGGLAWVGDGGRSELIRAGGTFFKTPDTPMLVNLPKHAQVFPDYERAMANMSLSAMQDTEKAPTLIVLKNDQMVKLQQQSVDTLSKFLKSYNSDRRESRYRDVISRANNKYKVN